MNIKQLKWYEYYWYDNVVLVMLYTLLQLSPTDNNLIELFQKLENKNQDTFSKFLQFMIVTEITIECDLDEQIC